MNLEQDIEPFVPSKVSRYYWDEKDDHVDYRAIVNAIDSGGGQTCDVPKVLIELFKAGYRIVRIKS